MAKPSPRLRLPHYLLALTVGFVGVPYFALMHINPFLADDWRAARNAVADAALNAVRRASLAADLPQPSRAPASVLAPPPPLPTVHRKDGPLA